MSLLTTRVLSPEENIAAVADLMRGRRTAVLTGAGVSTDSGIPDYRGKGAPKRTPMNFAEFVAKPERRGRYWAGSYLGWHRFSTAAPNQAHRTIADLEARGLVSGVMTQNVDGLHAAAGSSRVVELHGSLDRVYCMDCGTVYSRAAIAQQIEELNPWIVAVSDVSIAPDGDAVPQTDPERFSDFVVPACQRCGGMLKPDIVFFGEFVPPAVFDKARSLLADSDVLLVAGSSLVVNTGIRLLAQARRQRSEIIIINRGMTKSDSKAAVKIDAGVSETLEQVALLL